MLSIIYLWKAFLSEINIEAIAPKLTDLFGTSSTHISRLPNQFIFNFIFTLPLLLISNTGNLGLVAEVGILLTIVRAFDLLIYPLNFNLVPDIR